MILVHASLIVNIPAHRHYVLNKSKKRKFIFIKHNLICNMYVLRLFIVLSIIKLIFLAPLLVLRFIFFITVCSLGRISPARVFMIVVVTQR